MLAMMHPLDIANVAMHHGMLPFESILGAQRSRCLHESESEYKLVVQAPGVKSEDVTVSLDDCKLKVSGKTGTHTTHTTWARLPRDANVDQISASCVDGLLTVTIAKRAPAEPTTIAVHTTPQHGSLSSEQTYTITLASAGLAAVDLNIQVDEDGVLTVSGETERTGVRVHRSYRLPADAHGELTHATHIDGVTRLLIPKVASTKAAIPVASGNENAPEEALDGEAADSLG